MTRQNLLDKIPLWLRPKILAILFLIIAQIKADAQEKSPFLPDSYTALQGDTARMRFLVKAIEDSLDKDQLTHILDWSRIGLAMAENNNVDTMKGIFYFDIAKAYTYYYQKHDSAIFYYKKVLPYFPDKMRKYNAFSIREIMDRYANLGNKDSSFVYLDTLKALIDTMPDSAPRKISLSLNIATVYQWFGMYRTAVRYFQVAINGERKNKNFPGLGLALANLGLLYNEMEDDDKAIKYSKEALIYLENANMPFIQTASNLSEFYTNKEQYDSALVYYNKSTERAKKINDASSIVTNKNILASIYIREKKYDLAKNIFDQNLDDLNKTDNKWDLCSTFLNYAKLDTTLHQYERCKVHLNEALKISKENQFLIQSVIALQELSTIHAKTGDYKSALQYHIEYMNLKDSVASEKAKADLNDLEISYKTTQKEQEIALLKKDNDIKNLQIRSDQRLKIFYLLLSLFLIAVFSLVYYQRNQRSKMEMQKIKAQLETKVLRLQMNPHFIFNSLNSIENFIMQNEKRLASDYLNKFARLIRMILDSSSNEVVPISKDMETLQLYIDLEQLRFNNKFSYNTFIDPALMGGDYRVPSLLIQPYVENAIVHGLAHSEEEGLNLTITAALDNESIKYVIQDNGIGREKAAEYNRRNKPYHKSIGLKITEDRIRIFNNGQCKNEPVKFTDLYDPKRNPDGTKVEVNIKAL